VRYENGFEDALGNTIEEKAGELGDSVTATFKDSKERVKAGIDSIKQAHSDKTH
jgi:hypothetical protein